MINAAYRNYRTFDDFIRDILFTVMEDHHVVIICNWQDVQGLIASINNKVLNGKSLALDIESAYHFDDDIATAQMNDGNMLITIFDNATVICEAALFTDKPISFIDSKYFVEYDAICAMNYAITNTIIPFKIEQKIRF